MQRRLEPPASVPSASRPATVELSGRPDGAFSSFYQQLDSLSEGRARRVRVSLWGDSHVAGAVLPARLRKRLQERLGNGGPGFVLLGRPWRSYRHLQVKMEESPRRVVWRAERLWSRYSRRRPQPRDDLFGLAGISVHARRSAFVRIAPRERRDSFAALDLYYLRQPGGGRIVVQADGQRVRWVLTVGSEKEPGFARVELPRGTRKVELVSGSVGEVRLYGADLDSGEPGVVLDAFGINGARASSIGDWNEGLMTAQLKRLAPDLIVLAYGSNEVDQEGVSPARLRSSFDEVVARMRRMAPAAGCLVLGPPDQARFDRESGEWRLPAQLDHIIAAQRTVATARGCAFWDQRAAMGGPGSIFSWVNADPPLARNDHVHLHGEGYRRVADALYEALMQDWQRHRQRQRTPDAVVRR
ncbi:MAG: hypothetical protein JRI55_38995 [Deltaproteobacteria bacterium]|jgi:lysophospholipase L1-like esterase|nr:hypothetical protein [Deltaproteobacteria bacterium]